jgi:hypothetical protein
VLLPRQRSKLARGAEDKEHAMSEKPNSAIAVIGIDIGKNSFHVVGLDDRGAIVPRQKWSRRSTKRSNQRPDTLMQDRNPTTRQTSCDARPDHTSGHERTCQL